MISKGTFSQVPYYTLYLVAVNFLCKMDKNILSCICSACEMGVQSPHSTTSFFFHNVSGTLLIFEVGNVLVTGPIGLKVLLKQNLNQAKRIHSGPATAFLAVQQKLADPVGLQLDVGGKSGLHCPTVVTGD